MKILVISDRYPPYHTGGYEIGCKDAVDALQQRGHQVRILTSTFGVSKPKVDDDVYRWLESTPDQRRLSMLELFRKELQNQQALRRVLRHFKPELVYIWKLNRASVSLALLAQAMGFSTSYYVFDRWINSWERDPWYALWNHKSKRRSTQMLKNLLRPAMQMAKLVQFDELDLSHVQLCSHYIKQSALQAGKPVEYAEVIHWGVDPGQFPYKNGTVDRPRRLLYVGRIVSHKGIHTAIEATAALVRRGYNDIRLTIVGDTGRPSTYLDNLEGLIRDLKLQDNVQFVEFTDRALLPVIYREHDILLFPSVWEEPFGITMLEAMSSGLPVIGTGTGGSSEVLQDNVNGLIFPKEDAEACADRIESLLIEPHRLESLRQNARASVEQTFKFEYTVDRIETSLEQAMP